MSSKFLQSAYLSSGFVKGTRNNKPKVSHQAQAEMAWAWLSYTTLYPSISSSMQLGNSTWNLQKIMSLCLIR